jgi:hypothetical protein
MQWSEIALDKDVWTVPADRRRNGTWFSVCFRDWAGNVSNFPREVVKTALAHVIGDKVEQAYRRSDALKKRRKLMNRILHGADDRPGYLKFGVSCDRSLDFSRRQRTHAFIANNVAAAA